MLIQKHLTSTYIYIFTIFRAHSSNMACNILQPVQHIWAVKNSPSVDRFPYYRLVHIPNNTVII